MELVSLILFFVYLYGFGFAATSFLKKAENLAENFWERNIMRLGIGVAVFALVGIILNFLRIPLDWKIFLFLSLIAPGYYIFKHRSNIKSHIKNIVNYIMHREQKQINKTGGRNAPRPVFI